MFQEYNAHPKGIKTGDCVVRALTVGLSKDYNDLRRELNQKKREWGFDSYKSSKFLLKYLEGYPRYVYKAIKGEKRIKGNDFAELHPEGTYILSMAGHVSVCMDGVIFDTWDCTYRSVYAAWEVTKVKQ